MKQQQKQSTASWQRYLEQLEKENEHLREQNKNFMELLRKNK